MAEERTGAAEVAVNLGARLRTVRQDSGLSLREVARQLGVSPSFVSQLETGKSQPSVATLYSLAQLLDFSIDQIFSIAPSVAEESVAVPATVGRRSGSPRDRQPESQSKGKSPGSRVGVAGISRSELGSPADAWTHASGLARLAVMRPHDRPRLVMDSGVIWTQLASNTGSDLDFIEVIYPARSSSTNDNRMLQHAGFEYGYLIEGELEMTVGFEVFMLHAGESMGFDSAIPHLFRNLGVKQARGIWCVRHPRGYHVDQEVADRSTTDSETAGSSRQASLTPPPRLGARRTRTRQLPATEQ